jgi:hypothetical protein
MMKARQHTTASSRVSRSILTGTLVCAIAGNAFAAGINIGFVTTTGASIDGAKVPAGTALLSPAVVETADRAAIVHLSSGGLVAVEPTSAAHLQLNDAGELELTVDKGSVRYRGDDGEVVTLAQLGQVAFTPQGQVREGTPVQPPGQVGEGEKVGAVDLCVLDGASAEKFKKCTVDSPGAAECNWELAQGDASRIGVDAVEPGNNSIGLDNDCKPEVAVVPVTALTAAAIAAAILADQAAEEETISPVEP